MFPAKGQPGAEVGRALVGPFGRSCRVSAGAWLLVMPREFVGLFGSPFLQFLRHLLKLWNNFIQKGALIFFIRLEEVYLWVPV